MDSRKLIGDQGEKQAAEYLEHKGFEILAQNWRHKHLEVDIIAKDGIFLIFVEVKVRKSATYGYENTLISNAKQKALSRAAEAYIFENSYTGKIRVDLISIIDKKLTYIKDAFWNY